MRGQTTTRSKTFQLPKCDLLRTNKNYSWGDFHQVEFSGAFCKIMLGKFKENKCSSINKKNYILHIQLNQSFEKQNLPILSLGLVTKKNICCYLSFCSSAIRIFFRLIVR